MSIIQTLTGLAEAAHYQRCLNENWPIGLAHTSTGKRIWVPHPCLQPSQKTSPSSPRANNCSTVPARSLTSHFTGEPTRFDILVQLWKALRRAVSPRAETERITIFLEVSFEASLIRAAGVFNNPSGTWTFRTMFGPNEALERSAIVSASTITLRPRWGYKVQTRLLRNSKEDIREFDDH